MTVPATIETFQFADKTVKAYIPAIEWLQQQFENKESNAAPYWAQVWPAAKALCEVIASEPELVKDKTVLELAAGLGLPSLLAAQFSTQVTVTDYINEAVDTIKRSVLHNKLQNVDCRVMDWKKPDKKLNPDLLVLSDMNYDPKDFDQLFKTLACYIQQGTGILLSTPQRLMAKPFMEKLLPWQVKAFSMEVSHKADSVFTSVWLLKK